MVHYYPTLEVRKRNPGHLYPKSSSILRVIYCPTPEKKRRDLSLPILNTASYFMVDHYPTQERKKTDQGFPSLQCRRFLPACKCFARESACWNSKRGAKMGRVKRSGVGGGEMEEKTPARKHCENEKHPLISRAWPLFWKWVPLGLLFVLSLIFLRQNKDGGYNSTSTNKQLSPTQNTPALQAKVFLS